MALVTLSERTYRDKVMGCWYGKSAGGTLGTPLERLWGEDEPFNVDWYPELREGGIPNDDLEIQLVWLQALEERGLDITARDLAEYWLDCIHYNYDEYGLHKTNLRLGLDPPVSGWFNNYFKHCMGCPIRSEIWACIAPGLPHVAANYAWHDGVCDHAGGESVYGEMFNAAVESAAFVISDRDRLLDIGLAMIPSDSLTAKAIQIARQAHAEGLDWLAARKRVMDTAFSRIAQYSPINLGFQTIGWLYGADFGHSICTAVNCGWDTDCTGATLGSILGIINGVGALPRKWLDPLGDTIVTSFESGGLRNLHLPQNMAELTDRIVVVCRKVLACYDGMVEIADRDQLETCENLPLIDRNKARSIYQRPHNSVTYTTVCLSADVSYPDGPAVAAGQTVPIALRLTSRQAEPIKVTMQIEPPAGFEISNATLKTELRPDRSMELTFQVTAPGDAGRLEAAHRGWIKVFPEGRPAVESLPFTLIGSRRWLISSVKEDSTLETPLDAGLLQHPTSARAGWQTASWPGNELPVEPLFNGRNGTILLEHYIESPDERPVRIGVPNSNRMKLWVNGIQAVQTQAPVSLRPNYGGDGQNYADVTLNSGWNRVLIEIERGTAPVEAHFTVAEPKWAAGQWDLLETRFPWE